MKHSGEAWGAALEADARRTHEEAAKRHNGHTLMLKVTDVTLEYNVTITDAGNVKVDDHQQPTIEQRGDGYVWCDTCLRVVRAGTEGLADDWEEL